VAEALIKHKMRFIRAPPHTPWNKKQGPGGVLGRTGRDRPKAPLTLQPDSFQPHRQASGGREPPVGWLQQGADAPRSPSWRFAVVILFPAGVI